MPPPQRAAAPASEHRSSSPLTPILAAISLNVVGGADPTHRRLVSVSTSNSGEFNSTTGSSVVAKGGNGRRYENVSIILRCDSTFLNHLVGDQLCNVIAATPDGVARR